MTQMTMDAVDRAQWVEACNVLPYAHGAPMLAGQLKLQPEDFEVDEVLGFEPDGRGEHVFILVEKRGLTTADAQLQLSRTLRLHPRDIAYSGMKDRQALTRQWFSLHVPKGEPALEQAASAQLRILRACRNSRKLRRGSHAANRFRITLRTCSGDRSWLPQRVAQVATLGVPNYFGPQRFGNECSTLLQSADWLEGRTREFKRSRCSLLLSAGRAFLFNRVLAARVDDHSWNTVIEGEVLALAGTGSVFPASRAAAEEIAGRLAAMDLHPSGPLWGNGQLMSTGACAALEQHTVETWSALAKGLAGQGLRQERRALRLQVRDLQQNWDADDLQLEFTLEKGSYATSVLRELIKTGIT